jgi:hypothetical protein
MEWFTLAVLVPAVLVPIVLLWGFSGCGEFLDVGPIVHVDPLDLQLAASDVGAVTLTWRSPDLATFEYHLFRTLEGQPLPPTPFRKVSAAELTVTDRGLTEGTTFFYQVKAVNNSGTTLRESHIRDVTTYRTLFGPELPGYTGVTADQGTDQPDLHGFCFVVRIPVSAAPPPKPWTKVRLTIRGSTQGKLTLDRITISSSADVNPGLPPAQREAWNANSDLRGVATNVALPAGDRQAFTIEFSVQAARDVLVAFDLTKTTGEANARYGPIGPAGTKRSYFKRPGADGAAIARAVNQNRDSDYSESPAHYFVERIEVV